MDNNPYIKFIIEINSKEIEISKTSVYRLMAYEGIEAAEYQLSVSENAQIDGGYIDNQKIIPRSINISFVISDKKQTEDLRKYLISFLNPKHGGVLTVERNGVTRKINFVIDGRPRFEQANIIQDRLRVTIPMLCADPFFTDIENTVVEFKKFAPLLTFPFNSLEGVGITGGVLTVNDVTTITNNGDVEVGIICEITAKGGNITNPKISCNGEYVKAIKVLEDESIMTIDTRKGSKNIQVDGVSEFIFDRTSIFFSLPVGANTILISADINGKYAKPKVEYSLKYMGV